MRRIFPALTAIWVALLGAVWGLSKDFASDWLKDHHSLKDIEDILRPHWLLGVLMLVVLAILTLWAWLACGKKADPSPSDEAATKPSINVSPTISPTISPTTTVSPTISPNISPTINFSPTLQVTAPPHVPHQLRPPPKPFIGREDDLRELLKAVREEGAKIAVLRGMAGIGKTALALKLAAELAPAFPDGQIYLDLKGALHQGENPGLKPLTRADAMDHVIRSYHPGAPAPNNYAREPEYHNALSGKRVLLLFDNALNKDQVEALVPPDGCMMIVTSRDHFALYGCKEKDVTKLPPAKARDLMLTITQRISEYADDFAKLCDYLPEALRATASAIAERQNLDPQEFLHRMNDAKERLKITGVELSLTTGSALLNEELQRRWLLLGVFPDTFESNAVAAIWECEIEAAQDALSDLLRYSLIEWNSATRRHRLHDLARDFTTLKLDESTRLAAQARHATYYQGVLEAAERLFLSGGASALEGLARFDLEWRNIQVGQAWAAVTVARKVRDRQHESAASDNRSIAYNSLGECRRAVEFHEKGPAIAVELGDYTGEGRALGNLGVVYRSLGAYRRAIQFHEQDLAIAREAGDRRSEGATLGNLGIAYCSLGEPRRAIEFHEQALAIARELGHRPGEGNELGNLGIAYESLGEYGRAIESYQHQLAITREIGDRAGEARALWSSALALDELGDRRDAIHRAEEALNIYRQIESPLAEKVRKQLAAWRKTS